MKAYIKKEKNKKLDNIEIEKQVSSIILLNIIYKNIIPKDIRIFLKEKTKKDGKRPKTDIKIFLKKKKKKSVSIIVIELRIFLKKKNKRKLSIGEIII